MASFAGIPFSVYPASGGNRFANVEDGGGDDPPKLTVSVELSTFQRMQSLLGKVTRLTANRSLGTKSWDIEIDNGYGPGPLVIGVYGGQEITHTNAVLMSMNNIQGYGATNMESMKADLEFWIFGDITPALV